MAKSTARGAAPRRSVTAPTASLQGADGPTAPEASRSVERVMQEVFGFPSLLPGQAVVVNSLLRGQSALAIFPTGGGKSLCYQVPSQILDGLTVVVSPLIALMKDQVAFLKGKGIAAESLDSSLTAGEAAAVKLAVRNGTCRILYVSPERFNNESFLGLMKACRIALLSVDEAHCISEWGHSFRPDYLRLARFAKECNAERVLALTATATNQVGMDICTAFGVPRANIYRTPFHRSNLELRFTPVEGGASRDTALLDRVASRPPGPSIVYVTQQKTADAVAALLREEGHNARAYHAGMTSDERTEVQEWFMAQPAPVVAATIAFGMGIDRADIRSVFHYNMPKSLEGYSQEIGRAGRDGRPSVCELLAAVDDVAMLSAYVHADMPSKGAVRGLLRDIWGHDGRLRSVGDVLPFSLYDQGREHDIKDTVLKVMYAYMDLSGGLLTELTPRYSVYQFEGLGGFDFRSYTGFHADVIQQHMEVKRRWTYLDVAEASAASGVDEAALSSVLGILEDEGKIACKVSRLRHRFRVDRCPEGEVEQLVQDIYGRLRAKELGDVERVREVVRLVEAEQCQTGILLQRFGSPEEGLAACGHCQWCLEGGRAVKMIAGPSPLLAGSVDPERWSAICSDSGLPRRSARLLARFACGMFSPHISRDRLSKHPLFGSMKDHDFSAVLEKCAEVCSDESD